MRKWLLTIITCLAFVNVQAQANDDDTPVDNKSTYHITDTVDLVSKTDVQYEKPRIVIRLVYPSMQSSDGSQAVIDDATDKDVLATAGDSKVETFNREITDIIHQEIKEFQQKVADATAYQSTVDKTKVRNRLSMDYSSAMVNLDKQPIISVRFIIQGFMTGMKQPFVRYRTYNFDMDSGNAITLADNFKPESAYLTKIAAYVHKDLTRALHGKINMPDEDSLSPEQFNNWNINLSGLRISFDDAAVAPAAFGSQSVLIPYSVLKPYINPDSALGQCLAHQRNCMREHLLTGGFIDEAANTSDRSLYPILS